MGTLVQRVMELKGYPDGGLGLLPAMRQAVRTAGAPVNHQLWDVAISRQGSRFFLHLYFKSLEEEV